MSDIKNYVRMDDHGAYRIGGTKISLDSVVYSYQKGCAPESIIRQFPILTLEEIYGAITYYLANRKEVEEYLERQNALWERLRAEQDANPPPVIMRLRELKKAQMQGKA